MAGSQHHFQTSAELLGFGSGFTTSSRPYCDHTGLWILEHGHLLLLVDLPFWATKNL